LSHPFIGVHLREIDFSRIGKQDDDKVILAKLSFADIFKRAFHRRAGRSAAEKSLFPGKPPAHEKRVAVGNRHDLVDILRKEVLRYKVLANPFDLVRV